MSAQWLSNQACRVQSQGADRDCNLGYWNFISKIILAPPALGLLLSRGVVSMKGIHEASRERRVMGAQHDLQIYEGQTRVSRHCAAHGFSSLLVRTAFKVHRSSVVRSGLRSAPTRWPSMVVRRLLQVSPSSWKLGKAPPTFTYPQHSSNPDTCRTIITVVGATPCWAPRMWEPRSSYYFSWGASLGRCPPPSPCYGGEGARHDSRLSVL